MNEKVFHLVPASGLPLWLFAILVVFLIAMLVFFARFAYWSKNTTLAFSESHLEINGGPYGRTIPLDEIKIDEAEVINLEDDERYKIGYRSNGIAIPGYRSGWFKMKSGATALVFLTEMKKVLMLPTTEGYILLLTIENPGKFVETLKATSIH